MNAKFPDLRPLIHVCVRHDFVDEMSAYLYSNDLLKYMEVYAVKVSHQKTHRVVGKLLDLGCPEDFVPNLLNQVGQMCPSKGEEQVEHHVAAIQGIVDLVRDLDRDKELGWYGAIDR
jgi:clathrin heavy chain